MSLYMILPIHQAGEAPASAASFSISMGSRAMRSRSRKAATEVRAWFVSKFDTCSNTCHKGGGGPWHPPKDSPVDAHSSKNGV